MTFQDLFATDDDPRRHQQAIGETRWTTTDHPLARTIEERPEVYEAEAFECAEHTRVLVTFEGWGMPEGFAEDYDLDVTESFIRDPRSTLRRIFSWGQPARFAISATRETVDLREEMDQ